MAQLNTRIILRNDSTVNWEASKDQILLKGEVGVEFLADGTAKIKIGDGVKTWEQLEYFGGEERQTQIYELTLGEGQSHQEVIDLATDEKEVVAGDIAIVKELIAGEGAEAKYMYTAYVYNGTGWAAMDGNYNAKNVFFDQDFTFTKAVGTVTIPSSGSKVVDAAGKNLYDFFAGLFAAEDTEPDISSQPSVSACTLGKAGSYEAGTIVTGVTYSASFEDGKYQYGPEPTGVTVSSWEVKGNDGVVVGTAASGSINDITIADDTNYTITAKATYGNGNYAKTNLGNESTVRIAAGNKSKTSSAIKGYRNSFYGTFADTTTELTSSAIRGLTATNATMVSGSTFKVEIPANARRVVIALPAGVEFTATHDEGLNAPVESSFTTKETVLVEGAGGRAAINYDVYVAGLAGTAAGVNHYSVTIK